jgi:hypothetical protein
MVLTAEGITTEAELAVLALMLATDGLNGKRVDL